MKLKKSIPLMIVAAFLSLNTISAPVFAQGSPKKAGSVSNNLNQNVYTLDTLADTMVFRYGWAMRSNRGCKHCVALHKHMKKHAALTNDLVKASRGKCPKTFKKAARDVKSSVAYMQALRKKAEVGKSVGNMMDRSTQVAAYVNANSHNFNKVGPTLLKSLKPVFAKTSA